MSYILSALKKAEQERQSGDIPDVLTSQVVEEPVVSSTSDSDSKPYLIGGIAVLFLAGGWLVNAVFLNDDGGGRNSPLVQQEANLNQSISGSIAAERRVQIDDLSLRQNNRQQQQSDTQGTASLRTTLPVPTSDEGRADVFDTDSNTSRSGLYESDAWLYGDEVLDIAKLPPSLRNSLPKLSLTGHLYSLAHPNARKVILNGVALKEKQYLDNDLMVSEITPGGVIIDFKGRLFQMSANQIFR